MLHIKKLATAAAAGLLLTITACSSQGGAQNAPGGASGGGGDSSGPSLTIAMVTHEADVAEYAERTIRFLDGHVASDSSKLEVA